MALKDGQKATLRRSLTTLLDFAPGLIAGDADTTTGLRAGLAAEDVGSQYRNRVEFAAHRWGCEGLTGQIGSAVVDIVLVDFLESIELPPEYDRIELVLASVQAWMVASTIPIHPSSADFDDNAFLLVDAAHDEEVPPAATSLPEPPEPRAAVRFGPGRGEMSPDLLRAIFVHCSVEDVLAVRRVCRAFRNAINAAEPAFWDAVTTRQFGAPLSPLAGHSSRLEQLETMMRGRYFSDMAMVVLTLRSSAGATPPRTHMDCVHMPLWSALVAYLKGQTPEQLMLFVQALVQSVRASAARASAAHSSDGSVDEESAASTPSAAGGPSHYDTLSLSSSARSSLDLSLGLQSSALTRLISCLSYRIFKTMAVQILLADGLTPDSLQVVAALVDVYRPSDLVPVPFERIELVDLLAVVRAYLAAGKVLTDELQARIRSDVLPRHQRLGEVLLSCPKAVAVAAPTAESSQLYQALWAEVLCNLDVAAGAAVLAARVKTTPLLSRFLDKRGAEFIVPEAEAGGSYTRPRLRPGVRFTSASEVNALVLLAQIDRRRSGTPTGGAKRRSPLVPLAAAVPNHLIDAFVCDLLGIAFLNGPSLRAAAPADITHVQWLLDSIIEDRRAEGALSGDTVLLRALFDGIALQPEFDRSTTNLVEVLRAIVAAIVHPTVAEFRPLCEAFATPFAAPDFVWTGAGVHTLFQEIEQRTSAFISAHCPSFEARWRLIQSMELKDEVRQHILETEGGLCNSLVAAEVGGRETLESILALRLTLSTVVVELYRRDKKHMHAISQCERIMQLCGFRLLTNTLSSLGIAARGEDGSDAAAAAAAAAAEAAAASSDEEGSAVLGDPALLLLFFAMVQDPSISSSNSNKDTVCLLQECAPALRRYRDNHHVRLAKLAAAPPIELPSPDAVIALASASPAAAGAAAPALAPLPVPAPRQLASLIVSRGEWTQDLGHIVNYREQIEDIAKQGELIGELGLDPADVSRYAVEFSAAHDLLVAGRSATDVPMLQMLLAAAAADALRLVAADSGAFAELASYVRTVLESALKLRHAALPAPVAAAATPLAGTPTLPPPLNASTSFNLTVAVGGASAAAAAAASASSSAGGATSSEADALRELRAWRRVIDIHALSYFNAGRGGRLPHLLRFRSSMCLAGSALAMLHFLVAPSPSTLVLPFVAYRLWLLGGRASPLVTASAPSAAVLSTSVLAGVLETALTECLAAEVAVSCVRASLADRELGLLETELELLNSRANDMENRRGDCKGFVQMYKGVDPANAREPKFGIKRHAEQAAAAVSMVMGLVWQASDGEGKSSDAAAAAAVMAAPSSELVDTRHAAVIEVAARAAVLLTTARDFAALAQSAPESLFAATLSFQSFLLDLADVLMLQRKVDLRALERARATRLALITRQYRAAPSSSVGNTPRLPFLIALAEASPGLSFGLEESAQAASCRHPLWPLTVGREGIAPSALMVDTVARELLALTDDDLWQAAWLQIAAAAPALDHSLRLSNFVSTRTWLAKLLPPDELWAHALAQGGPAEATAQLHRAVREIDVRAAHARVTNDVRFWLERLRVEYKLYEVQVAFRMFNSPTRVRLAELSVGRRVVAPERLTCFHDSGFASAAETLALSERTEPLYDSLKLRDCTNPGAQMAALLLAEAVFGPSSLLLVPSRLVRISRSSKATSLKLAYAVSGGLPWLVTEQRRATAEPSLAEMQARVLPSAFSNLVVYTLLAAPRTIPVAALVALFVPDPAATAPFAMHLALVDQQDAFACTGGVVRSAVFCMPQMLEPVAPETVAAITALQPEAAAYRWLIQMAEKAALFDSPDAKDVYTAEALAAVGLPFTLPAGLLAHVYATLVRLAETCARPDGLTNLGLVAALHPIMAAEYATALGVPSATAPPGTPLVGPRRPPEQIFRESRYWPAVLSDDAAAVAAKRPKVSVAAAASELLASVDLSLLGPSRAAAFLDGIASIEGLSSVVLVAPPFSPETIGLLLLRCPALETLDLRGQWTVGPITVDDVVMMLAPHGKLQRVVLGLTEHFGMGHLAALQRILPNLQLAVAYVDARPLSARALAAAAAAAAASNTALQTAVAQQVAARRMLAVTEPLPVGSPLERWPFLHELLGALIDNNDAGSLALAMDSARAALLTESPETGRERLAQLMATDVHAGGRTAFDLAVFRGFVDCVAVLTRYGPNLFHYDTFEMHSLHRASVVGNVALVRLLLEHFAAEAVARHGPGASRRLTHFDFVLSRTRRGTKNALHLAAECKAVAVMALLLAGTRPCERLYRCFPANDAFNSGSSPEQQWADVPPGPCSGWYYIGSAATEEEDVRLQHDLLVAENRDEYKAPLHTAARQDNRDGVALLMAHGAPVNQRASDCKFTPLHFTSSNGFVYNVLLLLQGHERGDAPGRYTCPANPAIRNLYPDGTSLTCVDLARRKGHYDIAQLFLDSRRLARYVADPALFEAETRKRPAAYFEQLVSGCEAEDVIFALEKLGDARLGAAYATHAAGTSLEFNGKLVDVQPYEDAILLYSMAHRQALWFDAPERVADFHAYLRKKIERVYGFFAKDELGVLVDASHLEAGRQFYRTYTALIEKALRAAAETPSALPALADQLLALIGQIWASVQELVLGHASTVGLSTVAVPPEALNSFTELHTPPPLAVFVLGSLGAGELLPFDRIDIAVAIDSTSALDVIGVRNMASAFALQILALGEGSGIVRSTGAVNALPELCGITGRLRLSVNAVDTIAKQLAFEPIGFRCVWQSPGAKILAALDAKVSKLRSARQSGWLWGARARQVHALYEMHRAVASFLIHFQEGLETRLEAPSVDFGREIFDFVRRTLHALVLFHGTATGPWAEELVGLVAERRMAASFANVVRDLLSNVCVVRARARKHYGARDDHVYYAESLGDPNIYRSENVPAPYAVRSDIIVVNTFARVRLVLEHAKAFAAAPSDKERLALFGDVPAEGAPASAVEEKRREQYTRAVLERLRFLKSGNWNVDNMSVRIGRDSDDDEDGAGARRAGASAAVARKATGGLVAADKAVDTAVSAGAAAAAASGGSGGSGGGGGGEEVEDVRLRSASLLPSAAGLAEPHRYSLMLSLWGTRNGIGPADWDPNEHIDSISEPALLDLIARHRELCAAPHQAHDQWVGLHFAGVFAYRAGWYKTAISTLSAASALALDGLGSGGPLYLLDAIPLGMSHLCKGDFTEAVPVLHRFLDDSARLELATPIQAAMAYGALGVVALESLESRAVAFADDRSALGFAADIGDALARASMHAGADSPGDWLFQTRPAGGGLGGSKHRIFAASVPAAADAFAVLRSLARRDEQADGGGGGGSAAAGPSGPGRKHAVTLTAAEVDARERAAVEERRRVRRQVREASGIVVALQSWAWRCCADACAIELFLATLAAEIAFELSDGRAMHVAVTLAIARAGQMRLAKLNKMLARLKTRADQLLDASPHVASTHLFADTAAAEARNLSVVDLEFDFDDAAGGGGGGGGTGGSGGGGGVPDGATSSEDAMAVARRARLRQRRYRIKEIVETEQSYAAALQLLVDMRREMSEQEVAPAAVIDSLIPRSVESLYGLACHMAEEFERAKGRAAADRTDLGLLVVQVLAGLHHQLLMFGPYVQALDAAQAAVEGLRQSPPDAGVNLYVRTVMARKQLATSPLESYLIKPFQRVTKYPLLLDALLSETPATDPSHAAIEAALKSVQRSVFAINAKKRDFEMMTRVSELAAVTFTAGGEPIELIESYRRVLAEDTCTLARDGIEKAMHVVLCNDLVLFLATPQQALLGGNTVPGARYVQDLRIPLSHLTVENVSGFPEVSLFDSQGDRVYTLSFASNEAKSRFHGAIRTAIDVVGEQIGSMRANKRLR